MIILFFFSSEAVLETAQGHSAGVGQGRIYGQRIPESVLKAWLSGPAAGGATTRNAVCAVPSTVLGGRQACGDG